MPLNATPSTAEVGAEVDPCPACRDGFGFGKVANTSLGLGQPPSDFGGSAVDFCRRLSLFVGAIHSGSIGAFV
jgi:hypothetical protein